MEQNRIDTLREDCMDVKMIYEHITCLVVESMSVTDVNGRHVIHEADMMHFMEERVSCEMVVGRLLNELPEDDEAVLEMMEARREFNHLMNIILAEGEACDEDGLIVLPSLEAVNV